MKTVTTDRNGGTVYTLEAIRQTSTFTGMVFGHYACDADDRPARVVGWHILRDGKIISRFRTKRDAQAFINRKVAT